MPISPSLLRESVSYDPENGHFFWLERPLAHFPSERVWRQWNVTYAGKRAFAVRNVEGYLVGTVSKKRLYAHRAAWAMMTGVWPTKTIDHRNGDRSDNRWANLREATRHEQNRNVRASSKGTSRYLGVSFRKERGNWRANIFLNGRQTYLGAFATEERAAQAYDVAAAQHFGEYARLNFPQGIHSAEST